MKTNFFWKNFTFNLALIVGILILFSKIPYQTFDQSSLYQIFIPFEFSAWIKAILMGGLLAFVFSYIQNYFFVKRLKEINLSIDRLTGANPTFLSFSNMGEFSSLAQKINEISEKLGLQIIEQENEKKRLETILEAMVEGVLVIDPKMKVQKTNQSFRNMFLIHKNQSSQTVFELTRNNELNSHLESVFKEKSPVKKEIVLNHGNDKKYVMMHTAPFFKSGNLVGLVSVFSDITEVRRLENIRKDFVANVSHELKTPLTNILGYAETIQQREVNDTELMRRFISKIETNARYLQNLVKDLLDLSFIEHGQWKLNPEWIILENTLIDLKTFFQDDLDSKKIHFNWEVKADEKVWGDQKALWQILSNLIDNAIKYTSASGEIHLAINSDSDQSIITIRDNGQGMNPEDVERIFERFYRADKSRSEKGTGLGLAIVKHLIQAHGGKITVESKLDQGTTFTINLPKYS